MEKAYTSLLCLFNQFLTLKGLADIKKGRLFGDLFC